MIRRGQRRYAEAAAIHREVLESERRSPGPKHPNTLTTMHRLASVLADDRRYAEAEAVEREALESLRGTLGPSHPKTLAATNLLAFVLEGQGRPAEAEPLLRANLSVYQATQPVNWQRFNCESLLGASLRGQRKAPEAGKLLLSGYSGMAERQTKIPALDRIYLTRAAEAAAR